VAPFRVVSPYFYEISIEKDLAKGYNVR